MPRDYLVEGREYVIGVRRALPDVELVCELMREIDALHEKLEHRDRMIAGILRGETVDKAGL